MPRTPKCHSQWEYRVPEPRHHTSDNTKLARVLHLYCYHLEESVSSTWVECGKKKVGRRSCIESVIAFLHVLTKFQTELSLILPRSLLRAFCGSQRGIRTQKLFTLYCWWEAFAFPTTESHKVCGVLSSTTTWRLNRNFQVRPYYWGLHNGLYNKKFEPQHLLKNAGSDEKGTSGYFMFVANSSNSNGGKL